MLTTATTHALTCHEADDIKRALLENCARVADVEVLAQTLIAAFGAVDAATASPAAPTPAGRP